jgi:hypothetical protein
LLSGTGRGFETAPLRKHKRCVQGALDNLRQPMKTLLGIICLLVNLQVFGQSEQLVGKQDDIIDTIKFEKEHFIRFYRKVSVKAIDLDFDKHPDSIEWFNYMSQSIERRVTFFDYEQKIKIKNKHGDIVYKGSWEPMKKELINNSIARDNNDSFSLFLKLNNITTALILAHRLTGSDIDAYTIIKIDSLSKPQVVFDSEFILTTIKDLDGDGFSELIGKHPNFAIPEYTLSYVPVMVFKYSDSLRLDNKLTFAYNLPYKSYREFPESSITILTEENLRGLTKDKLRLMRNEIFADYGHVFKSPDLNVYFKKKSWYKPRPNRSYSLTDWEKKNIETIKRVESK